MERELVRAAVEGEKDRQVRLQQSGRFRYTPKDSDCPEVLKLAMLLEELGEISRCVQANLGTVQEKPSADSLRKELTQLAALSEAWLECPTA